MMRLSVREALRLLYDNGFKIINVRGSHFKLRHTNWRGSTCTVIVTGCNHKNKIFNFVNDTEAVLRECIEKGK